MDGVEFDSNTDAALCVGASASLGHTLDITGGRFTRNGTGLRFSIVTDLSVTDTDFGEGDRDNEDSDVADLGGGLPAELGASSSFVCQGYECTF
jgi:hypothetical protein